MPMKNKPPSIGTKTHDARAKDEKYVAELNTVEEQSKSLRDSLIDSGKRDEMAMKQPKCAPELKDNDKIQFVFKHVNNETNSVTMEWCKGTVKRVSDGTNLRNASGSGPKFYKKGCAIEIECHAHEEKGEKISYSIEEINKSLFNCYVESGWRLFFNVRWNNKLLQSRCNDEINNENEE